MDYINSDLSNIGNLDDIEQELAKKQDLLVSGVNIKTFNGQSLLGEGDIGLDGLTRLSQDLVVLNDIGGIHAGKTYVAGTPLENILIELLSGDQASAKFLVNGDQYITFKYITSGSNMVTWASWNDWFESEYYSARFTRDNFNVYLDNKKIYFGSVEVSPTARIYVGGSYTTID